MNRKRRPAAICTVEILRETENQMVMAGDVYLLHMVAERCGIGHHGPETQKRVLDAIDRTNHDHLIRAIVRVGRWHGRCFWIPEHAPEVLRKLNR